MSFYTISLSLHKDNGVSRCHLHLGSNQDDPKLQIARALQFIEIEIGPIFYVFLGLQQPPNPSFCSSQ